MRLRLAGLLMLSALIVFSQPVLAADNWRARLGAESSDKGTQALAFLPNEMWIHESDSITWTFSSNENHSITFLKVGQLRPTFAAGCPGGTPPNGTTPDGSSFIGTNCVNSGLISTPGATYTVNFPTAGNYVVVCLIHVNQSGTIHVLKASDPLPHDQDFYDRQAAAQEHDLLSDRDGGLLSKLREDTARNSDEHSPHAHDGLNIVVMGAGEYAPTSGGAQSVSIMRFGRESITIHAGQTVEWASSDVSGHSVQFGTGEFGPLDPATASPDVVFSRDTDGALHAILTSTNDNLYSGRIAPAAQERTGLAQLAPGATRFRVSFTTPGTYPYICAYHDGIGMKGEVIVLP
jgi:plastocyanin